jgi:hypothetical protein
MKMPCRTDNHMMRNTTTKKQTEKTTATGLLILGVSQIGKTNARYLGSDMIGATNSSATKSVAAYIQRALSIFHALASKYARRLIANRDSIGSKT